MFLQHHSRDFQQSLQFGHSTSSWILQSSLVPAHEKIYQPDRKCPKESHKISQPIEKKTLWNETKGTMLEMYKLTYQFYDSSAANRLFESNARIPRGKQKKVMSRKAIAESSRYCFTVRAAKDANNLPEVITFKYCPDIFKTRRCDVMSNNIHAPK